MQGVQEDHPREYGENSSLTVVGVTSLGPSPRIRGKYPRRPLLELSTVDHPREYGENGMESVCMENEKGPSPRIRGKSTQREGWEGMDRTIPANTGKIVIEE